MRVIRTFIGRAGPGPFNGAGLRDDGSLPILDRDGSCALDRAVNDWAAANGMTILQVTSCCLAAGNGMTIPELAVTVLAEPEAAA